MQTIATQEPSRAAQRASQSGVAIRLENLSKTYPGASERAVDGLSLEVADGEVFTLLGPSGCGSGPTATVPGRPIGPRSRRPRHDFYPKGRRAQIKRSKRGQI